MKSVSVRLTFADDEFYETHIAPRKFNNELPGLVLRLITAYVSNEELAYEIDQFLDKDNEPEVYEARSAIMEALSRLNMLENNITQDIEALGNPDDATASPDMDDDDFVVTDGNGIDTSPVQTDAFVTPSSLAESLSSSMGISMPKEPAPEPTPMTQAQSIPNQSTDDSQIDKILSALSTITGQVSQLTATVNTLVSSGVTTIPQPMQYAQTAQYVQQMQPVQQVAQPMAQPVQPTPQVAQPVQPVAQPVQPAQPVAQPATVQEQPTQVAEQPVQTEVQPDVSAQQPVIQDLPFAESSKRNPFANSPYAAIPQDTPAEDDTEDFEIPDFMISALDNINA